MLHLAADLHLAQAEKVTNPSNKEGQQRLRKLYNLALKEARSGLALARRLDDGDSTCSLRANLLATLAQAQGLLERHQEAVKSISEARQLCRDRGDLAGECNLALLLAQIHGWNDTAEEGQRVAEQALTAAQQLGDDYLQNLAAWLLQDLRPRQAASAEGRDSHDHVAASAAYDGARAALGPYTGPTAEALLPRVNQLVMDLVSSDEVYDDTPLMETGLDSLSMVQLRNSLQSEFKGVPMPSSVIFDYPAVRPLSDYIATELEDQYWQDS